MYKLVRRIYYYVCDFCNTIFCYVLFYCQNIVFSDFKTTGIPYVSVTLGGKCTIGRNFNMHNGLRGNPIGRPQKCVFFVKSGASLSIGNNVGISQTALICHHQISIGNYVKIGGGVCIYDTDFHSLDPKLRIDQNLDFKNKADKPVIIEDNVFIGAHSTILKGVTIGHNSIIGACSVVTKNIGPNEIWGGNPANFIKKITNE